MKFSKPATTFEDQLDKLIQRGMNVGDRTDAIQHLSHLNYYRMRGYWYDFETDHTTHTFKPNTHFHTILNIYFFDKKLRLLLLNAIERVEISLRTQWAYYLAHTHGPHSHLNANIFRVKWAKRGTLQTYQENVDALIREVTKSRETFIRHFDRFEEALPPVWAICEIMMLGSLSKWYANLAYSQDRNAIARGYKLDEINFVSFIHHLTIVRNICAHHSRLWNRLFTVKWKLPIKTPKGLYANFNPTQNQKIYNTLVMLAYLMDIINPNHGWKTRLFHLINEHDIDVEAMGFPADYAQFPIWQTEGGGS